MIQANDTLSLYERMKSAYGERNVAIQRNRDFVLGNQWSASERDALPEGVTPVTMNYCWPIVLKNTTFLVGRSPEIAVPVSQDTPEAREYAQYLERVLYGVHEFNRMNRRYGDMAQNCSVAGGQPVIIDWDPVARMVRWSTPLPERVYALPIRDDDSLEMAEVIIEEHYAPEYLSRRYGGTPESWKSDFEDGGFGYCTILRHVTPEEHVWVNRANGEVLDRRVGYGFVPYVYIPNIPIAAAGAFDGLADVTPIIGLQRKLNHFLTLQADILEMYADPPVIIEGGGIDPNSLEWGPGMKIPIERDGRVYFLQWEGTAPDFREHVGQILSGIQDLSNIPDVAYGRYEASIQSGIALNTQFQPTRLMMALKQNAWCDAFEQIHRLSVRLMRDKIGKKPIDLYGMNMGDGVYPFTIRVTSDDLSGYVRSKLVWPGMLPKDDVSEQQMLITRYQAGGISLYTLLEQLGHESPSDEKERL